MNSMNKLLFSLFLSIPFFASSQIPWPVVPFNQQHILSGTPGEYRNTGRIHLGVDILGPLEVYPIYDGVVSAIENEGYDYEQILVSSISFGYDIWYVHVVHDVSLTEGSVVFASETLLGTMVSQSNIHVHIQNNAQTMLHNFIHPYEDDVAPIINAHSFRRNGHNLNYETNRYLQEIRINNVDHKVIFNKVDIVVNAHDPGGNYTLSPLSLTYEIFDANHNSVDQYPVEFLTFENYLRRYGGYQIFGIGTTFDPENR